MLRAKTDEKQMMSSDGQPLLISRHCQPAFTENLLQGWYPIRSLVAVITYRAAFLQG